MNFLAHVWLAGEADADRLGGLMGDFVKGPLPAGLPPDIAAGVRLHRAIDSYAEQHPAFCHSRSLASPARRRFAGVMVDMFYDHLLACHWAEFCAEPLPAYASRIYALLEARRPVLPAELARLLAPMREGDWLASYRSAQTIAATLDRLARRLRQPDAFVGAGEELAWHVAEYAVDFRRFMADAADFAARHRAARCAQ